VHQTFRNAADRASGVSPCLGLKKAAMTTKEIGSSTGVQQYNPFG